MSSSDTMGGALSNLVTRPVKVWVLTVEGNTDYYFDVVGVYATKELAEQAQHDAEQSDLAEGEYVEGLEEYWAQDDFANEVDWTRSYTLQEIEVEYS